MSLKTVTSKEVLFFSCACLWSLCIFVYCCFCNFPLFSVSANSLQELIVDAYTLFTDIGSPFIGSCKSRTSKEPFSLLFIFSPVFLSETGKFCCFSFHFLFVIGYLEDSNLVQIFLFIILTLPLLKLLFRVY